MELGSTVGERFVLEAIAGTGGMGTVYRARDRATGELVAVKLLQRAVGDAAERFAREIRVLAQLRHPGIVRYHADGVTDTGEPWLAMEWLDGESLMERLARSGLTASESVGLARRVAEAVGAAHERGVIHRDLKPSNIMLPGGDLERVVVLDFGVARISGATRGATGTGVVVGTPGYMAPEQVRGERDVGTRADVFAIGCVLFECLAGRPAYYGEHVMAVLAKIVLEDPPRVTEWRPDLPPAFDEQVGRMLAKRADDRPRDCVELAAELARLESGELPDLGAGERPAGAALRPALTATEQRLLCVVLIGPELDDGDYDRSKTISDRPNRTITLDLPPETLDTLGGAARKHGGHFERLADGSYVVTLAGSGGAGDQVVQAARCALALRAAAPRPPIALATGRGVMAGRWPVGEAIDRAVGLLAARAGFVRIDDVTAGLLDTRFEIGGDDAGLYLASERDVIAPARTLLGKATPCVGRDRELGVLFGLFDEAVAEPMARAVVVTGGAGVGKSRLRDELLKRIAARGEPVEVWIGRGDGVRAGSPFGVIAPALRRAFGILDGEPLDVRRHKLRARVSRHIVGPSPPLGAFDENCSRHGGTLERTTSFLGELVGAPFPDDDDPVLRAARQDPMLMSEQIRRAFERLLAAETAAQPVVIVLEDFHAGDLPTVKLIDAALRALPDRPWLVLALARPELHELFPRLWADRAAQELRLDELTRKSSERLVRRVLGDGAPADLVARILDRAGGNAFYLEELIRAVADGKGDAMPETVLAVVQGRLERLEGDARRVLRAASVFGHAFWRGGVAALLGGGGARELNAKVWLDELVERELVRRARVSRFPDDDEFTMTSSLVREAAYAMLTDADRRLGHQLAGDWLERAGEGEPMVLAEHFERGGDHARAARWYVTASERALAACDFAAAIARAQRGAALCRDARGDADTLGGLRLAEAEARKWTGDFARAAECGREAMALLPAHGRRWFAAAAELAEGAGRADNGVALAELSALLCAAPAAGPGVVTAQVTATAHAAFQLVQRGDLALAEALLDRVEQLATTIRDPASLARVYQCRSSRAAIAGDAGAYLEHEQAAAEAFERAGDLRYACMQRGHVGYACLEIGAYVEAERWLRDAQASAEQLGLPSVVATAKHNLGRALWHQGRLDDALATELDAVRAFSAQGDRRLESAARLYTAYILADRGDLAGAETEMQLALATAQRPVRAQILASLARVALSTGRAHDAVALAREAADLLDELGAIEEGESLVRLMLAETLAATGERAAARGAVLRARDRVLDRAARISDPGWRDSFLVRIVDNARTLELARTLQASDK